MFVIKPKIRPIASIIESFDKEINALYQKKYLCNIITYNDRTFTYNIKSTNKILLTCKNIKYCPKVIEKIPVHTPIEKSVFNGIYHTTVNQNSITYEDKVVHCEYITNVNLSKQLNEIINDIKKKLTLYEIEYFNVINNTYNIIKIHKSIKYDLASIDPNKYYNLCINCEIIFGDTCYILFTLNNITET
jgi:hypothetical protein